MAKIKTRVTFDKIKAAMLIKAAANDALTDLGIQALQDIKQYVPVSGGDAQDGGGGDLRDSGFTNSDKKAVDGKFTMRWDTPYAQYLWHGDVMYGNPTSRSYGPEKLKFTAALAREEWAKYAKEVHGEEWKRVYQAALNRRLES